MTRGRGFSSSYRGSSGSRGSSGNRSSWGNHPGSGYSSSRGNNMPRFSSFSNSFDSRSRYTPMDRYGGSTRNTYDDYHKSYRSDLSSSYSGRDRSPERKRLRDEAPRRNREVDSFSSSSSRYAPSMLDRNFRDRRPPPPPTISRREEFRRPLPPSTPRGGYRGRLSSRGFRGVRLRDGPPRRRLIESSYTIRRRLPPLISSDYARRFKVSRLRSTIRRTVIKRKRDSDSDDDDDEKKSGDETVKKEKNEKEDSDAEGKEEKDKDGATKKKDSEKDKDEENNKDEKSPKKEYIKLVCPHCNMKCITFGKYASHLHGSKHMLAMRQVAHKQKGILGRLRLTQRNAQRELEKSSEDLAPRTNFCPLCKLNYKQPKAIHQASDAHKSMKKFLMPYCKVCRITFKSPMIYETHVCSIEHIKRRARIEVNGEKSEDSDDLLNDFTTLDSVDDNEDSAEGKKDKDKPDAAGKQLPINVGIEQIKKVEVHYCDLCRMYLPRVEEAELEKTLTKHCKQRIHLQRYIRFKEDKEIASRAEKLQRKETAEKDREKKAKEDEKKADDETKKPEDIKVEGEEKEKVEEDENMDDKLWADDVNKDLGDILAEAESGNKSSDDEGDERFDRFGTTAKNGDEVKEKKEETDVKKDSVGDGIESK